MPDSLDTPASQGFDLEIVVNELAESGEWLLYFVPNDVEGFTREPVMTIPVDRCVQQSPWNVPTLTPEVLLFYKATAYKGSPNYLRRRDHLDFERLLPRLDDKQRGWLADAITLVDADHPWLGVLTM